MSHDFVPFTDGEIALAAENYESQEWLARSLRRAFAMTNISEEQVADELGLPLTEAHAWLRGDVALTLPELRQLANAIDAHVSYRVTPMWTSYTRYISAIEGAAHWQPTQEWAPLHAEVPA